MRQAIRLSVICLGIIGIRLPARKNPFQELPLTTTWEDPLHAQPYHYRERRQTMNELASIVERLKALRLSGMAEAISDIIKLPVRMRPSLKMALSKMPETETRCRDDSRTARLLKASKLRYQVLVEDITCSTTRNFTREQLTSIADCGFVRRGENPLIAGLTGCGKSYLACALGHQACTLGLKTLYLNMNRFVDVLKQSRLDGTFSRTLSRLDKWYDYIAEATLADAIMDRLVNSSHHVSLEGPSLRKRKTNKLNSERDAS